MKKIEMDIKIIEEYDIYLGYRRGWHLWIENIEYFFSDDVFDDKESILEKIGEIFDKRYK